MYKKETELLWLIAILDSHLLPVLSPIAIMPGPWENHGVFFLKHCWKIQEPQVKERPSVQETNPEGAVPPSGSSVKERLEGMFDFFFNCLIFFWTTSEQLPVFEDYPALLALSILLVFTKVY